MSLHLNTFIARFMCLQLLDTEENFAEMEKYLELQDRVLTPRDPLLGLLCCGRRDTTMTYHAIGY